MADPSTKGSDTLQLHSTHDPAPAPAPALVVMAAGHPTLLYGGNIIWAV